MADFEDRSLPNMQFEDGDVLIKLSSNPKDWRVLHKDILAASSPVMARSLLGRLAGPHFVWHPVKKKTVKMWTLLLHYESDSDTYWLQSEYSSLDALNARVSGLSICPPQESKTWDVQHRLDHDHQICVSNAAENLLPQWVQKEWADTAWDIPLPSSQHDHRSHIRHAHKLLCETDRGQYRSEPQYTWHRASSSDAKCIHSYDKGYRTVEHLKFFFALLYGYACPTSWDFEEPHAISNILSYAEFYDCVEHIQVQLQCWMCQHRNTFANIEANWIAEPRVDPTTGIAKLARTFRCGPVLIDHVRNAIVNARTTNRPRSEIAKVLGLSIQELDAMAPLAAESLLADIREDELVQELIKGQLNCCIGVTGWDMEDDEDPDVDSDEPGLRISDGLCRLPEAADIWKAERPQRSLHDVQAAQIATMIYSQWFANSVAGPSTLRMPQHGYNPEPFSREYPAYPGESPYYTPLRAEKYRIPHIAYLVTTASKSQHPHLLFGENTPSKYVRATTSNSDAELIRAVKIKLDSVVERVAEHLAEWQDEHQWTIRYDNPSLGPVTFRSIERPGESCNYFPYAVLREDALPWAEEEPWVRRALPQVDETPASEAFLRELGFPQQETDEAKEVDSECSSVGEWA